MRPVLDTQLLTISARGLGFALDRTLYLDGRTDPSNKQLLGATALKTRTAWSEDQKQLVETHQIKTKQGKEGELIIKRYLINDGKSMVVAFTVNLNAELQITSASGDAEPEPPVKSIVACHKLLLHAIFLDPSAW